MARVTGRREHRDGVDHLVLERHLTAPIEQVWHVLTDPDRMSSWMGTWRGDPGTGRVEFQMIAHEGQDFPFEPWVVEACEEASRLAIRSDMDDPSQNWILEVRLTERADDPATAMAGAAGDTVATTLVFTQVITPAINIGDVGPGWEYHLDRLVSVVDGGDGQVDFADYAGLTSQYAQV